MKYNIYISTDVGKVRTNNEDNFAVNNVIRKLTQPQVNLRGCDIDTPLLCAVFDGMGGESSGEVASHICAEEFIKLFKIAKKRGVVTDDDVDAYVNSANFKVNEEIINTTQRRGGSTFAMAYIDENHQIKIYSLGDSRIYLYHDKKLTRLTKDHTLAMKKYYANIYTLEEAEASNDSHKLTSFLGVDIDNQGIKAEKYPSFTLSDGDKLLLCSDGLYDMCKEDEILKIMAEDSDTISYDLVEAALNNGGIDNTTCMVIEVSK